MALGTDAISALFATGQSLDLALSLVDHRSMIRAEHRARAVRWAGWHVRSGAVVSMTCALTILVSHPAEGDATPNPIGAHSMLQVNDPPSFMQTMFAEAAGMHVSAIRLDVAPALIYTDASKPPDFSGLDEVMTLSRRYDLRVVADLITIPSWMAACQASVDLTHMSRCGTDDLADYRSMISQIVAHADPTIRDWEIWNEPDQPAFFAGTPQQYARMLRAAHDAVKDVDPGANVLLGGISSTYGASWLAQVFATPGADAGHAFDIANVHERGRLDSLATDIGSWKRWLMAAGFNGPLWVTEHGYPSDPPFQYDSAYSGGPSSQAAYLAASVPTLIDAGAGEVFVTERDNLSGQYASEGVLGGDVGDPPVEDPQEVEKPAYDAVRIIADCYSTLGRSCNGPAPKAFPPSLSMPVARLGSPVTASVSVSDPGPGPVRLGVAARVGSLHDPIVIQADACSDQLLEPDHPCTLALRFKPTEGGQESMTLLVPSANGGLTIPVTAVAPSVSALLSPQVRNARFTSDTGRDGVGDRQRLVVQLRNPLSVPVSISRMAVSGPGARLFRIKPGNCLGTELSPDRKCAATIVFTAAKAGTATATLTIGGSGEPLRLALRATAYGPPSVTGIASSTGRLCFGLTRSTRLLVATDQPSIVRWRLKRRTVQSGATCRGSRDPIPGSGSLALSTAGGRSRTGGRVDAPGASHIATIALPVRTRVSYLVPGVYWLTVSASNSHGIGRSKATLVTTIQSRSQPK